MAEERDAERREGVPTDLSGRTDTRDAPESEDEIDTEAIRAHVISEDEIDRNLMGSFPASDPPSWTLGVGGVYPPDE